MIYLDYNATAPMKPAVRSAMMEAMERHGNPSSVHRYGRIARRYVDEARASVAALAGVKPTQVIFTSGGTEANNLILTQAVPAVLTSAIEHDSVIAAVPDALRIPVTSSGVIDFEQAHQMMAAAPKGSLVTVMMVNNETGVIQPIAEIADIAKKFGHKVHCDAVQAAGKLPIDFAALGVDALTLSAHKIGGAQGIGALIVGEKFALAARSKGGGQEMNRRAGTENIPGIIGFGVASRLAVDDLREMPRFMKWRDVMRDKIETLAQDLGEGRVLFPGADAPHIATTLCVALRGVSSETQVVAMDLAGVAVSAGAACSSGKVKASHVLRAMGCADDIAASALRFSFGWNTQESEITQAVDAWHQMAKRTARGQQSQAA
jgi:cysteine desulfurase